MDCRTLLKKYIRHIIDCEGTDFLDHDRPYFTADNKWTYIGLRPYLSDEDWKELDRLSEEVRADNDKRQSF